MINDAISRLLFRSFADNLSHDQNSISAAGTHRRVQFTDGATGRRNQYCYVSIHATLLEQVSIVLVTQCMIYKSVVNTRSKAEFPKTYLKVAKPLTLMLLVANFANTKY